ncbi:C4-dicarboxylate ABC transporter permease [Vibrio panuliri]|uniref:TRAP transporter small permease protein n=2 Tax=Vibrio panuliri TaxID=1381081 RepID=A0A1Q9HNW8_9VIBR|nr:C4-dicarboxylate ABC transporter permease [Vibrio panuliri]OLQ92504.1 C4-dicarboxylate ABC transporter permease [Vibrio panuliri]
MWLMVFAVVWQVFTRFVINSPSVFTDELSRYLMMWVGILGGAYVYALKRHLAIEILSEKVNPRQQLVLNIVISGFVILFSAIVLLYGGVHVVTTTLEYNQVSPSLSLFGNNIPMGYIYMVAPISGAFIVMCAIADILNAITALKNK